MEKTKSYGRHLLSPTPTGTYKGMYSITLWWNKKYYFPSTRKALRFIAIVNQFYTKMLYESRSIYIDVWVKSERSIPYLTHNNSAFPQAAMRRSLRGSMHSCEKALDLINERSHWDNGNWIVRNQFRIIIDACTEAVTILKKLYKTKNNAMEIFELDSLGRRIELFEITLLMFGDEESRTLNKPKLHDGKIIRSAIDEQIKLTVTA